MVHLKPFGSCNDIFVLLPAPSLTSAKNSLNGYEVVFPDTEHTQKALTLATQYLILSGSRLNINSHFHLSCLEINSTFPALLTHRETAYEYR